MSETKYEAELAPMWRLQEEEPAPLGTKLLFLTPYGHAVVGHYYNGCDFLAWCRLPALTTTQKQKLQRYLDGGAQDQKSS